MSLPEPFPKTIPELLALKPTTIRDEEWLKPADPTCNFTEFDSSFFDLLYRVFYKYIIIPQYAKYEAMDLEELTALINPPASGRNVILGMTEFLFPYIAYILRRVKRPTNTANRKNAVIDPNNLPFLFYAPSAWSDRGNCHFIDCLAKEFHSGKFNKFIILMPADPSKWVTPSGAPRVTLKELWRLQQQVGDPIPIDIKQMEQDEQQMLYITVNLPRKHGGRRSSSKKHRHRRTKRTIRRRLH